MRTSMFAEAAAQLGECTCLVVGVPEGRLAQYGLPDGVRVEVIESHQDTRLKLIAMAQPAGTRQQLLLDYGLPSLAGRMPATTAGVIAKRLSELQPDLLVISRAYMLPVLDHLPETLANVPVAVDLDDDDAAFQMTAARLARLNGEFDDAAMNEAEAVLFDKLIGSHGMRVKRFWLASELSRKAVAARLQLNNLSVANNAVDLTAKRMPAKITPPCLLFVGNLGYQPNSEGICWFIRESLPQVRNSYPDINIVIAGSSCPPDLRKTCRDAGLNLVDGPICLDPLYAEATAVIVPLRIGSGSRLKIIEAGAYGIPVIATHTGAEGLDLDTDRKSVV